MATLTIILDTGTSTFTRTPTISAAHMTRIRNAFQAILQEPGMPPPTEDEIFDYWLARWKADTIAVIQGQERVAVEPAPIVFS